MRINDAQTRIGRPGSRGGIVYTRGVKRKLESIGMKYTIALLIMLGLCAGTALAGNNQNKDKSLPQGLQMKLDRGGTLPPGWQRKLARGEILAEPVYRHSEIVIPVDSRGLLTVRIEGKLIRLVEATREIIDIVDLLNP